MPQVTTLPVKQLKIDLGNYRTLPTDNETEAVHALIALRPHYFWDLTRSLIENGYDGTENIIVLKTGAKSELSVREGNRRVGALKIIHGILPVAKFDAPEDIENSIKALPAKWKTDNESVPCSVYEEKDADIVKRLVARTHARGETAGRLNWESVARARYNRNELKGSEPGLDLLEDYLKTAKKLSEEERERWGGDYPLTVLDEALQKVASRLGLSTARDVVDAVPKDTSLQKKLGQMIHDIGTEVLKTRDVRSHSWGPEYGFPIAPATTSATSAATSATPTTPSTSAPAPATTSAPAGRAVKTLSLSDPKSVRRELRKFAPKGKSSSKVVDLLNEAKKLKLEETPISFCFVLRSMFELSVLDYCSANGIAFKTTDPKTGKTKEKSLADLLVAAGTQISSGTKDKTLASAIKTAVSEIKHRDSVLSVPVMNALVHSATFTITPPQIVSGFHKIFPLLVALNK